MPKYAYHDLWDHQFEQIVVELCQVLLGTGVKSFSKGPDGGRDARFEGTARLHPSDVAPWKGHVVVQAKHTSGLNATYSDVKFFSKKNAKSTLAAEIPKIRKLKERGKLDHYMLFSNRKLSAAADEHITDHISGECNLPTASVSIFGVESIESILNRHPEVASRMNLNPFDRPLIFTSDEIARIIEAMAYQAEELDPLPHDPVDRLDIQNKNRLNNVDAEYFDYAKDHYLADSWQIQQFLQHPQNARLADDYRIAIDDIQLKLASSGYRGPFSEVMNYLFDYYTDREVVLGSNKPLMRSIIFHMYWFCDIGRSENANAIEAQSPGPNGDRTSYAAAGTPPLQADR